MSVAEIVSLPAQPAVGLVEYIPLGGDGVNAPIATWAIEVTLASDGSGGTNAITVNFDPRYSSVVQFMTVTIGGSVADVVTQARFQNTPCDMYEQNTATLLTSFNGLAIAQVRPPGMIFTQAGAVVPFCLSTIANTDTETHTIRLRMYNFVKELRQLAPNWLTMFNLPR